MIRSINAREDSSGATKDERSRSLIQGQLFITSEHKSGFEDKNEDKIA